MKHTSTKRTSCPPFKSCEKAELKHAKQYLFGETTEYPMRASTERRGYERQKTCGLRHDAPGIDCDSRAKSLVDG